jgi:DNA-binding MarR family transcriptional regulator
LDFRTHFMKNKPPRRTLKQAYAGTVGDLLQQMAEALSVNATGQQADPIQGNSDVLVSQWQTQLSGEDISALTIGIRVRRLAMLLDEIATRECEAAGVKLNDMLLLMALRRVGPPYSLRPTDILKMHSITSGTVTYRIDQLTKQDLAERVADPSDRRGYLIRLTPHGLQLIDSILRRLLEGFRVSVLPMTEIPGAMASFDESLRLFERCLSRTA